MGEREREREREKDKKYRKFSNKSHQAIQTMQVTESFERRKFNVRHWFAIQSEDSFSREKNDVIKVPSKWVLLLAVEN